MLRINLLPAYVKQRRQTIRLFWGFVTVFSVLSFCIIAWALYLLPIKARLEQEAQAAEDFKNKTEQIQTSADAILASVAPIQAKLDFVKACHAYEDSWVKIYDDMARYSYQANPKIIYSDASITGTVMTIDAYSPSIADIGRYLNAMYSDPGFQTDFTTIAIDHLPGYPDALVDKYYLDGKLVGIGAPPTGAATPNQPAGFGAAGPPPGIPAGVTIGGRGAGAMGGFSGVPSGGGGNPALGGFEAVTPIEDIIAPQISPLASPAQQQRQRMRILSRIKVKHEAKGFAVQITATLKKPLNPPVAPVSGAVPASAGTPPPVATGSG